jgi:hypothetical protein
MRVGESPAQVDIAPPARAFAWRVDLASMLLTVGLFVLLVLLATVGARLGWLRSFFGDVVAVVWVYVGFKTFIATRTWWLAAAALSVGLLVELGQYLSMLFEFRIENRVLRILLGSTPDWWDVLAYVLGFVAVLIVEAWWTRRRGQKPRRTLSI